MKRSRSFLIFVVILLVINAIFFTAWYGFGGKNWAKGMIERLGGKALGGKLTIEGFNLGERQAYLENVSFAATDSSLSFDVRRVEVRYNLFKFIFSRFKLKHILDRVEVDSPVVRLKIVPSEEEKPPSPPFRFPDLSNYFNHVEVKNGAVSLDLGIALEFGGGELLQIKQSLNNINITAVNEDKIKLDLSANMPGEGKLKVQGSLIKDRLELATAQISSFKPQYIHHAALGYPRSMIGLQVEATQATADDDIVFNGKLMAWNTTALLLQEHAVTLPFLSAEMQDNHLSVALSTSNLGNSKVGGHFEIQDPLGKLHLDSGMVNANLDLSMISPELSGFVEANIQAQGTIKQPEASVTARSAGINVAGIRFENIALKGSFSDDLLQFTDLTVQLMEHNVAAKGSLDPFSLSIKTDLNIVPQRANQDLALKTKAKVDVDLYEALPQIGAEFLSLSVKKGSSSLDNFSGYVNLIPATEGAQQSYYLDCDLSSPDGQLISAVGDILNRSLAVDVDVHPIDLAGIYPHEMLTRFAPSVGGKISGFMHQDNIAAQTELRIVANNDELRLDTQLNLSGSYNLSTSRAGVYASTTDGSLNGEELNFEVIATLEDGTLNLGSLQLNEMLRATAKVPLDDIMDSTASFYLKDVSTEQIQRYVPQYTSFLPDISGVQLTGTFDQELDAILSVGAVRIDGLKPMSANLTLRGPPENVAVMGKLKAGNKELPLKDAKLDFINGFSLDAKGIAQNFPLTEVLEDIPLQLNVSGEVGFSFGTEDSRLPGMNISADVSAPKLSFEGVPELHNIRLIASQSDRLLQVDTLYVASSDLGELKASGALDYNLTSGSFFEGKNQLDVQADLSLFEFLKAQVPMILDASGRSNLSASIGVNEDKFVIKSGNIDLRNGYLQIKDQTEPIRALNLAASITDNRLSIDRANLLMGKGRLRFFNDFDEEPTNHFFVGLLDLGILKLGTDEPGLLVNIPEFTAPRTLTKVMLKGRNDQWFTVSGPFDDMSIKGDVYVSDAHALYPPKTDNLLNLVYSFRGAFTKSDNNGQMTDEPMPLPFKLDLIIQLEDNIRYVTYPASMDIKPGGFLHLIYDGHEFVAKEAAFNSEKGKIDFLGTVFEAEYLNISIVDAQDLFIIDGSFIKRSPDGTIIVLSVTTDRDVSKPLMERLQFNLSSDNPTDQSITDILARMRYSGSSEGMKAGQETLDLQDEALMLLSDNINASILSPMLYPLENEIRRALKLDGFSIKAGFIQNLFSQYSSNPNQFVEYGDTNHFLDDVNQFGASILLNNLSISASKYLGRKMFLDYTLSLQEATDLQRRTRILVSHDTALRLLLPHQFRLEYTFKYEPRETNLSHELMLARSFRFWGL
ncbi:MAG TPA: hypothetical protein PL126_02440 [Candidatus Cloacimonadota bacterium]|nr:hypothetical protein [Candidatus Cloacimonadota bacterium]